MCDLGSFARHLVHKATRDGTGVRRSLDCYAVAQLAPNFGKAATYGLGAVSLLFVGGICCFCGIESECVKTALGGGYVLFQGLWLFAEWRGVRSGESCYAVKPPTVVRRLRYRIRLETRSIRCDLRAQQVFCDAGFFFWLAALVYAVSRTVQYQFTCGVLQDYYPGIQDEAQSVIAMLYLFSGVLIVASLTKLAYLIWVGRQILYRFPWSF